MVSAGELYTCGVTTTGAGYCWGYNKFNNLGDGSDRPAHEPRAVTGGHRFRSIVAARASGVSCGVAVEGAALCWGWISEALGRPDPDDASKPAPVMGDLRFRALSVGLRHFDEAEPARPPGLTIGRKRHGLDGAVLSEQLAHCIFVGRERQVAHVDLGHSNIL